jgi:hypothetical protein
MSSTVSLAIDPASPPTVPSNTSFFFSCSFNMRSSIVFSAEIFIQACERFMKCDTILKGEWRDGQHLEEIGMQRKR